MIFLLKYWKYIALVLAVLTLVGAGKLYLDGLVRKGYDQCLADLKAAKEAANESTRKEQSVIKKDTEKRKAKIYEKADDDKPVGSFLNRYFDGLRND